MHGTNTELRNDPTLLDLMLSDMAAADFLYRPTNFWSIRQTPLVDELRTAGLAGFRRRKNSFLTSFGATDIKNPAYRLDLKSVRGVNNRILRRVPGWTRLIDRLSRTLDSAIVPRGGFNPENLHRLAYTYCEACARTCPNAKNLAEFSESLVGDPEEFYVSREGNVYTIRGLNYYLRYLHCCRVFSFGDVSTIAELGSGAGRQAELLLKLHNNLTILLFDIAPQIYVAERYLATAFPGRVISYAETRTMTELGGFQPGHIYIFGSWQFPLLERCKFDVFWNAASMQEMEPDVVENYLGIVNRAGPRYVFIEAVMHGHHLARRAGEPGVLRKTTRENYVRGLSNYEIRLEDRTVTCFGDATPSTSGGDRIEYSRDTVWELKDRSPGSRSP
jgi:putative sugar O-methyltransferase